MSEPPHDRQRIVNLYAADSIPLIPGVSGRSGVVGVPPGLDHEGAMGIDLIEMEPGSSFPLHTHPGAHILFVLDGEGTVTIADQTYPTKPGDCYFIPGDAVHAVSASHHHVILAVGFPHRTLNDPHRMAVQE